jgi:hypothetical protein
MTMTEPTSVRLTRTPSWVWFVFGLIVLAGVVVGVAGINHNSRPSLSVSASGASYAATASGVACSPSNGSVNVSGTLTGVGPVSGIGPSATIYDGSGQQIGSGEGPLTLVDPGQAVPFNFNVQVNGNPASCDFRWGAGPPPGLGG